MLHVGISRIGIENYSIFLKCNIHHSISACFNFYKYGFDRLNSSNILVYTLVFIIIFCTQVYCVRDNNGASTTA